LLGSFSDLKLDIPDELRAEVAADFDKAIMDIEQMSKNLDDNSEDAVIKRSLKEEARLKMFQQAQESQDTAVSSYEKQVLRLTERVKNAADGVEREAEVLASLQSQIDRDPVFRLSKFRNQGLPRQMCLAAGILLFIRGTADMLSVFIESDPGAFTYLTH